MTHQGARLLAVSRFYSTPAYPTDAGPDFVNAACSLSWDGSPDALLAMLHDIEQSAARTRTRRWGARTLDLDLLAFDNKVMPSEAVVRDWIDLPLEDQRTQTPDTLLLPHPRLQDRAFVLAPLRDIAPHWRHPLLGQTVTEMLDALPPEAMDGIQAL